MTQPIFTSIPSISKTAPPFKWNERPGILIWESDEQIAWPVLKIEYPSREQFDEIRQWLNDHVSPYNGDSSEHWCHYLQMRVVRDVFYDIDGTPKYDTKKEVPAAIFGVDPQYIALLMLRFK